MKRPRQHEIDTEAENIFRSAIPSAWIVNPYSKGADYGKDFQIEIVQEGEVTGWTFVAQLKGKERVSIREGAIAISIDRKYLAYWLDKSREPVFLFVADVLTKKLHWLFVQEYLLSCNAGSWRSKSCPTVYVPAAGMFEPASFAVGVKNAHAFVAALRPNSIEDAVRGRRATLHSMDPRFHVDIELVDGTPTYKYRPRTGEIATRLVLHGPKEEVNQKTFDLLARGAAVDLVPGTFEMQGSPLFDDFNRIGGKLQMEMTIPVEYCMVAHLDSGRTVSVGPFSGVMNGGALMMHLTGEVPRAPLSFSTHLTKVKGKWCILESGSKVLWSFVAWDGQRLRKLAFFPQLLAAFNAAAASGSIFVEIQNYGNPLAKGTVTATKDRLTETSHVLNIIDKARQIAERCNVDPVFKATSRDTLLEVLLLYASMFGDGHVDPRGEINLEATFMPNDLKDFLVDETADVDAEFDPPSLFGEQVTNRRLIVRLTKAKIVSSLDDIQQHAVEGKACRITFRSTKESIMTCRSQGGDPLPSGDANQMSPAIPTSTATEAQS